MIYFWRFKILGFIFGCENFAGLSVLSGSGFWCYKISRTMNAINVF